MSRLVSARLLAGPDASQGRPLGALSRVCSHVRGLRTTARIATRTFEQTYFAPSFDGRVQASQETHVARFIPLSKRSKVSSILPLSWAQISQRSHLQHLAAASFAPPSDDPEITRKWNERQANEESSSLTTITPNEAILAGYRPVTALNTQSLLRLYRQLAKSQLTFLVTLTAMAGYALCPAALATSTSITTLLSMTAGTALCSASANAFNQLVESPYDAQMPRTRNRPMPSRSLTPLHAASFATVTGVVGVGALASINPLTSILGLANIALYSGVYTPMKRVTIVNTWVGSIVGAIPPLIGWTACTGTLHLATDAPGWCLAALLFAWQFPHFNSLAHTLRREYARGGYRMMSVTDPALNRRTSLRYAASLLPICSVLMPWTGVVHWSYAALSAPINLALLYASYGFWRHDGDKAARQCFWISLVHLPAVLLLAMACKTDVIEGIKERLGWSSPVEEHGSNV